MIARLDSVKLALSRRLSSLEQQGYDVASLGVNPVESVAGYDEALALAERMSKLPIRDDWPYVEPDTLEGIEATSDVAFLAAEPLPDDDSIRDKIRTGFLGSVCGCMLGKPLEMHPDMALLKQAATKTGEWPLNNYVTEAMLDELPRRHRSWEETVRERIRYAAPDDDVNYTVTGMLLLEQHGVALTQQDVIEFWLLNLPPLFTFGPERNTLTAATLWAQYRADLFAEQPYEDFARWNALWNYYTELCGAQIRADAYGYAFPGDPVSASRMAYVDASVTHRKTGVYATMFTAAAIAAMFTERNALDAFRRAAMVIPRQSRFRRAVEYCIEIVHGSADWLGAYAAIHDAYHEFGHCMIVQETGTLINSLHYAENVSDAFCKQVMQGNDTDSYGATSGAMAGVRFGSSGLDKRWLAPMNDTLHTTVAGFHDQSLSSVAERMAELPWEVGKVEQ
jgi:ADP-ribosylglycohydrolase